MLYLILFALSYGVFVFVAESFNPIVITELPFKRRRWRLGRQVGVIVFVVGMGCLLAWQFLGLDRQFAGLCFVMISALLLVPCLVRYKRRDVWG